MTTITGDHTTSGEPSRTKGLTKADVLLAAELAAIPDSTSRALARKSKWVISLNLSDRKLLDELLAGQFQKSVAERGTSALQRKLIRWKSVLNVATLAQVVAIWGRVRLEEAGNGQSHGDNSVTMPTVIRHQVLSDEQKVARALKALANDATPEGRRTTKEPKSNSADLALMSPSVWLLFLQIVSWIDDGQNAEQIAAHIKEVDLDSLFLQHKLFLATISSKNEWAQEHTRRLTAEAKNWHEQRSDILLPLTLSYRWRTGSEPVGCDQEYLNDHGAAARDYWRQQLTDDPDAIYPALSDLHFWSKHTGNLRHALTPPPLAVLVRERNLVFGPLTGLVASLCVVGGETMRNSDNVTLFNQIVESRRQLLGRYELAAMRLLGALTMEAQGFRGALTDACAQAANRIRNDFAKRVRVPQAPRNEARVTSTEE